MKTEEMDGGTGVDWSESELGKGLMERLKRGGKGRKSGKISVDCQTRALMK